MTPPDTALIEELLVTPKVMSVGAWIAGYDGSGRETHRKITCGFAGPHAQIGRLTLAIGDFSGSKFSLQVLVAAPPQRLKHPVVRIDIAPGRHHSNPLRGGDPDSGRVFEPHEGHIHDFRDSISLSRCDEFARQLPVGVHDFFTAFSYLSDMLNIQNPDIMPAPFTQGRLL